MKFSYNENVASPSPNPPADRNAYNPFLPEFLNLAKLNNPASPPTWLVAAIIPSPHLPNAKHILCKKPVARSDA